jgi:DNA ligase-associated metallophosphoesterase
MDSMLAVNGVPLIADLSGALWWPERRILAVADLHLEKGSSLARQGHLLPPYDTRATLARLAEAIARRRPARVIALGDSFHDLDGPHRLANEDREDLSALTGRLEWTWVVGNHDPKLPDTWGHGTEESVTVGSLVFRHQAEPGIAAGHGEISGHFHPKAAVTVRSRRITGRCFIGNGQRLILPAFGAFAGGLDVRSPAIDGLMGPAAEVHILGPNKVVRLPIGRVE